MGDKVRIGIIGGGSIGLLFGAYYSQKHDVTIYTKTLEQANLLSNQGIKLHYLGDETICTVEGLVDFSHLNNQDFIIIAVKQYDLASLFPILKNLYTTIPLLFIQNGMSHIELIDSLPQETLFVSTIEHGAKRLNAVTVEHTGTGKTNISLFRGKKGNWNYIPCVDDVRFSFDYYDDFEEMLLYKLIVNAVINPLTAIFNIPNGSLIDNPFFYQVFLKLFNDIITVFPTLNVQKTLYKIETICRQTEQNTSSMLKDIKEGRQTEIDAILGFVLKKGERMGHEMRIASMIYEMVKGLEYEGGIKK